MTPKSISMMFVEEIIMPHLKNVDHLSRRGFLRSSAGAGTSAAALQIVKPQLARGQGKAALKAGLIGVGGRGSGAVFDLLSGTENVEVTAMADIFEDQLEKNLAQLKSNPRNATIAARINVAPENRFVGFEAYKKLIASDVDIVILATPPGWRPVHFEAAVEARKHVFCEKPVATDATGVRRFMAAAKKSEEWKLTIVCGAQRRFNQEYVETIQKIKNGVIGEITAAYAYWMGSPVIKQRSRHSNWGEMEWQHRNWYSNLWLCGDQVVEQHFHNIDVINWVLGAHPISVVATGGAAWRPRDEIHGTIYDHISAEFVYPNGVRMTSNCRQYPGQMYRNISELVVGTRGRSNCHDLGTKGPRDQEAEHTALVASIRGDGPYINHAMTIAESTLTCIMARESAYSGQQISWEMILNSKQDLMPKTFDYGAKMDIPPFPRPGEYKFI
jgi:predicted dehydrogenase